MKRQIVTTLLAALACASLAVGTTLADHHGSGCGPIGGPVAPDFCAPAAPQFAAVQVTRYQPQMVEQEITEVVTRLIPKQENFTYTVQVPVVRPVKQTVTTYRTVQNEVAVPVTVMVPVTDHVKQTVTTYKHVQKPITVPVTTFTHQTVARKVMQTTFQCVPTPVTHQVPVCRIVHVPCVDPCTGCVHYTCQRVVDMQTVTHTVNKMVPTTQEVTVNEVVCVPVTQNVQRMVTECVPVPQEVTVPVTRMVAQQQTVKRLVCQVVPQAQEVTVNVCTYEAQQQQGTRTTYTQVQEPVKRRVQVCQMVPVTTTEQVAVGGGHHCGYPVHDCCYVGGHGRRGCCR